MFHALVAVKQVPDTTNIRIDPETGNLIRQGVPTILNPYDAHALAAAVEWKEKLGGKITVISMGPPSTVTTIRECIEMGADRGIIISARQFAGADTLATSFVLATVIQYIHEQDPVSVVLFGKQAIDGDTAQVGPGVSIRLGFPLITYAVKIHEINLSENYMIAERKTESYNEVIKTPLPAGLTCEKEIARIPYASLPNLVYSLKYEPEVWSAEEPISFPPDKIGLKGSPTWVNKTTQPELHAPGEVIQTIEVGVEGAVKTAIDKIKASGVLTAINGGAQ
ncbi:MAG TPA: electron transfer flavoprotein subunit beta/FixA family protein [Anaerolineaceae bacterium]|nr:electron transfer flavoprotein subunit beta/FixA family protein [Anaerolineaceae bacterium]HOV07074.1 electron transfer flavoprotein subunit beta/FixA family protein [Anaerolineaceae bacterium]